MMLTLIQVALGGAIGACLRFGAVQAMPHPAAPGFPVGVMAVNVVGSFVMGILMVLSLQRGLAGLEPLLMVGILGGFTTFSTFSLEAFTLVERGQILAACAYVGLSLVLSLGALGIGVGLSRAVLT